MRRWQLQEAKARFSELVKLSQRDGPQEISVRGEPAVVVLSRSDYDQLHGGRPSFVDFLRQSPLVDVELELERDRSLARDLPL
jgi:prevent-host-death family protein